MAFMALMTMLSRCWLLAEVVAVAGRKSAAAKREGRGGRQGRGMWYGSDGGAACGSCCCGDISRYGFEKGMLWCLESVVE